ncbi:TPA: hypothetical protein OUJ52_002478 [Morganella morganii]|nr:hypothetical protein [Morganella morganii]
MSDEKEKNVTYPSGFYVDADHTLNMKDFFNYLEEKEVSNKCPACGKMTMSGVIAPGDGKSLVINAVNKDASQILANECIGRICLSCSHVQFFWTNTIKSWLDQKQKEPKEK